MKKYVAFMLCLILILCALPIQVFAECGSETLNVSEPEETIYFDDGSYLTTRIISGAYTTYASTVTKTKAADYHNASGKVLFSLYVTGTFSINYGTSVSCTSFSHRVEINNSSWSCTSKSSYRANATTEASAIANGTFIRKILGIKVDTVETSVKLTCDKNGNFS